LLAVSDAKDRAEEELERARNRLDRPEGAELHPLEHERLMRLLHRSDALDNTYWTVLENSERNSEEAKAEIPGV